MLGSLVLGVAVLECVARFIPPVTPTYDRPSIFRGPFPENSLAMRDFQYPREKGPNHFRVLVFGDSFTAGGAVAYDDTYVKRLERSLNVFGNRDHVSYEVWNLAISGTSTPEQVERIRHVAGGHDPDLIILGYCLNDAEDWSRPRETKALETRLHVGFFRKPGGRTGFLYHHSALARLVIHRLFNWRSFRDQIRYYRYLYRAKYTGWQRTRKALLELGRYSRETRTPAVVMIFPLFSWGLGDHDYPFAGIHAKVQRALAHAHLRALDLLPFFRDLDRTRLEAVPFHDPHPSEIAHRIASDALWTYLRTERLVPGRSVDTRAYGPVPAPW
ncbi:MAG: hypothetical protein QOD06_1130 [Candidatus Binatota bacterium]|nr:hypothetical protein [Candidatus Binatota bacterium]